MDTKDEMRPTAINPSPFQSVYLGLFLVLEIRFCLAHHICKNVPGKSMMFKSIYLLIRVIIKFEVMHGFNYWLKSSLQEDANGKK